MGKTGNGGRVRGEGARTEEMRRVAHERLDWLIGLAKSRDSYGEMAVSMDFAAGEIQLIRHSIKGTDKPAT